MATKEDNTGLLLMLAAVVVLFAFTKKKKKGSIVDLSLDVGDYGTFPVQPTVPIVSQVQQPGIKTPTFPIPDPVGIAPVYDYGGPVGGPYIQPIFADVQPYIGIDDSWGDEPVYTQPVQQPIVKGDYGNISFTDQDLQFIKLTGGGKAVEAAQSGNVKGLLESGIPIVQDDWGNLHVDSGEMSRAAKKISGLSSWNGFII